MNMALNIFSENKASSYKNFLPFQSLCQQPNQSHFMILKRSITNLRNKKKPKCQNINQKVRKTMLVANIKKYITYIYFSCQKYTVINQRSMKIILRVACQKTLSKKDLSTCDT